MNKRKELDWRNTNVLRTRYSPRNRLGQGFVSVAPWLDIVLLLVLFLMLESRVVVKPGYVLDLSAAPVSDGSRFGSAAVVISFEGVNGNVRDLIVYNDVRFIVDKDDNMKKFRKELAKRFKEHPNDGLVVFSDKNVRQSTLLKVMESARAVGIKKVNMAVKPE